MNSGQFSHKAEIPVDPKADSIPTGYQQLSSFQNLQQYMQVVIEFAFLEAQRINRFYGMNDRRVIAAAKGIADFRITVRSDFTA